MSTNPNILIIVSDHLTQRVLGAYGNTYGMTPTMDKIAQDGIAFANAYTACPLCCPSRASFWTGQFPHTTKVLSNGSQCPHPKIPKSMPTLGETFKKAGYKAVHFGKCHDRGALRGFKKSLQMAKDVKSELAWPVRNDTKCDRDTVQKTVKFLRKTHKKPFIAVADFNNPHDICGWIGTNKGKHTDTPIPEGTILPDLPDNFEITDLDKRPKPIQYICCSHRRLSQASHWNEENYRYYLAAYYHYTNRVDQEIAKVMEALNSTEAGKNTLIVLMADHGDGITSHRMVTKQVSFYEETTRIPFIFAGNFVKPKGEVMKKPLVSLLDLFPTLCDFANIPTPPNLPGVSLKGYFYDEEPNKSHEFVVSEWYSEWCFTVSPGRMIRTPKYKYTKYLEGDGEELYDLENDPGEKTTLIDEPNHQMALEQHRQLLADHIKQTNDPFYNYKVKVNPVWREHELGYKHHVGSCAPSAEGNK